MNIIMTAEVSAALKAALAEAGKTAARFVIVGFGCKGPQFDIELSDKKDGDVSVEKDGVLFVAESNYEVALQNPEIIQTPNGFSVKRSACGC